MTRPGRPVPVGATSVEACLVAALLATVLLIGRDNVPRMLARALETANATFVSAVATELP